MTDVEAVIAGTKARAGPAARDAIEVMLVRPSRFKTDWRWLVNVTDASGSHEVVEMDPEEILQLWDAQPDWFIRPKGVPGASKPGAMPHPRLREHIAHMATIEELRRFAREETRRRRGGWVSFKRLTERFEAWAELQPERPEWSFDLIYEALRPFRHYRKDMPPLGPGLKRLVLKEETSTTRATEK